MSKYYELDKDLFEDENLKKMKLSTKVAYCILKNMIDENINIKMDKNNQVYVEHSREYLMEKMQITRNTITAIYKELQQNKLIEEKWIEVGKPNIVYVKNCAIREIKEIRNFCETNDIEKKSIADTIVNKNKVKEITVKDIYDAEINLSKINLKKFNFEYSRLEKEIAWGQFSSVEKAFIKIAIQYITGNKENMGWNKLSKLIDNDLIHEALDDCKCTNKIVHNENVFDIFLSCIKRLCERKNEGYYKKIK